MKRWMAVFAVCAVALAVAISSSGGSDEAIPQGMDAESWRPINDDLGVVLERGHGGLIKGTLMARVDGRWRPIALSGEVDLVPQIIPLDRR